jgi:hypothetical protein
MHWRGTGPALELARAVHNVLVTTSTPLPQTMPLMRRLGASDVFCQPSRREPFGLSILEAMPAGLAVVATDAGVPRYLLGSDRRVLGPVDDAIASEIDQSRCS